jgi:sugar lactone lactonase YvrE
MQRIGRTQQTSKNSGTGSDGRKNSTRDPDQDLLEIAKRRQKETPKKKSFSKFSSVALGIFLITFVLAVPFFYILITRLGFGSVFTYKENFWSSPSLLPEASLEIVAKLPFPPGNIAVNSRGRIFFSFHPEYSPPISVAELSSTVAPSDSFSEFKPFPSLEFQNRFKSILSLRIDHLDRLWILDYAHHAIQFSPVLYSFQLTEKENGKRDDDLLVVHVFPKEVAGFGSMLNDLQVDPSGEYIYIVDTGILSLSPGLIVYSVSKNRSFRVLSGNAHPSLYGSSVALRINQDEQQTIRFGPFGLKIHADSLALDRTGSRLYFGALTGNDLFSVSTSVLLSSVTKMIEFNLSTTSFLPLFYQEQLRESVRLVTDKKMPTDGLSSDEAGNLWLTGIEQSAIFLGVPYYPSSASFSGASDSHQSIRFIKVVQSKTLLRWPDGLSFGPDGLYISASALHLKFLQKNITNERPFHILRLPKKELEHGLGKGTGISLDYSFTMPLPGQ